MKELEKILKAINLANYDNLKTVEVNMSDLLLLKDTIESLQLQNKILKADVHIANAKAYLKVIESPVRLRLYV
jgi:hypothetical protein